MDSVTELFPATTRLRDYSYPKASGVADFDYRADLYGWRLIHPETNATSAIRAPYTANHHVCLQSARNVLFPSWLGREYWKSAVTDSDSGPESESVTALFQYSLSRIVGVDKNLPTPTPTPTPVKTTDSGRLRIRLRLRLRSPAFNSASYHQMG